MTRPPIGHANGTPPETSVSALIHVWWKYRRSVALIGPNRSTRVYRSVFYRDPIFAADNERPAAR